MWCERRPGPTREGGCYCWGSCKERGGPAIGASFSTHTLRWQGTTYMSCRGRYKPPLPSWTPEAGADHCQGSCNREPTTASAFLGACTAHHCHRGSCDWAPTAAPDSLGRCMTHHGCQGSHNPEPTSASTFLGAYMSHVPAHPLSRGKCPAHTKERDGKHPNQKQPS